ncbi:putative zinc finger, CCHC-type containing protein [Tanacetum coccineum]
MSVSGVRKHIMMMSDMENKLKGMDMEINKGFLVHFIMTSLLMQFGPFKINYNTQKEKWKISELIAMCVQEEERLKVEKPDVAHVATTNSNKKKSFIWKAKFKVEIIYPNKVQKTGCKYLAHPKCQNRKQDPETSSKLWHQRLGHISRDRMTRLVKDEVLPNLNSSDFEKCVECIKGKMTKGNKKGDTQSTRLLELIHTDICGPFPSGIGGHKSFITFFDDYSRYMYLFIINEKFESLEMFKTFKAEIENQLDRKIKVVRSDRGGEYYGRHTDVGQAPGSFFDFCKDHGIINQYTMSITSQQNGVAERRNCTLMDMVRKFPLNLFQKHHMKFGQEGNPAYDIYGFGDVQPKLNFLENANNSGSSSFRRIKLHEARDETPITHVSIPINTPLDTSNDHLIAQDHPNNVEENKPNPEINVEPQETQQPLHRSQRNSNNIDLLHESKHFLSRNFDMKDLGEASFNMQHCSPTVAPVIKGDVFGSNQCLKIEVEYEEMKRIPYASVVGSLTYAQVCGPTSWKSKKQVLTMTSTMMAEYVSVYNATCHAILLRNLITGLKIINSISRPLKIYCDNNAAVSFSNNNSSTGAVLYLDTKYLFVHEREEEQRISIEHIKTHEMLVDLLTKGLPPKVFRGHVAKIGLRQDLIQCCS